MKKKLLSALLIGALSINLAACGQSSNTGTPSQSPTQEQSEPQSVESTPSSESSATSGNIEVDEELFDVELTIPADFVGDTTQEELDAAAKENGFKSIILNDDGSATYTMTEKQHEKFLSDMREEFNTSLKELVGSENYPNFTDIKVNDNFTEITITTKSTELDLTESFSVIAFYMYGGMYAAFSGEAVDNISVTFVNADSGEVIQTANSSDMGN